MFPATRMKSCFTMLSPFVRYGWTNAKYPPQCHTINRSTTTLHFKTKDLTQRNKWITFRSILTRWIPLSSVMYISWCYIRSSVYGDISDLEIKCYEKLPLRITSRIWGKIAACELPTSLRGFVYGTYVRMFNVNMEEAKLEDLTRYKSLSEFFTRPLKDGVRIISPKACVSPCDGTVLACGPADCDKIEQVKGVTYSLREFLGENSWCGPTTTDYYHSLLKNKDNMLFQCTIYLAPGDYHRFHSCCDWTVSFRRHFSGKLLSVNPWIAKYIPDLFCLNERAVYVGEWQHGFFSYTAVGATNVGSIEIFCDGDLHTNKRRTTLIDDKPFETKELFKKGQLFGQFNMGSTIVLLFEAPKTFAFSFEAGDRVLVGEAIGSQSSNKER